jgi:hypothetical protein
VSTQGSWTTFAERLDLARNYWLHTTSVHGAPHVAPVWGAVVEAVLYVYSERRTQKAKNLGRDPRVVVHLESADDVLIVHGSVDDLGAPNDHPAVMTALVTKYTGADARYLPPNDPDFDVLWALSPRMGLIWSLAEYETSQVRWRAPGPGTAAGRS